MTDKWHITNLFTGEDITLPKLPPNEPTLEWIEGWEAGMQYGKGINNPYLEATLEWHEWQDGWQAAMDD